MKQVLKIVGILTAVCMLSGFFLSYAYNKLSPKIEENQRKEIRENIFSIAEDGAYLEEEKKDGQKYYIIFNEDRNLIGYAVVGEGNGYQGKIKILIVLNSDLNALWGIQIIDSQETPGLGAKINGDDFRNQFKNLIILPQINLVKGKPESHNEISAISGATISSTAVVKITNETTRKLKEVLKK